MRRLCALALLFAVGSTTLGCGARASSASASATKRAPFQPGTVLRHAPPSCAGGHLFLDLPRAEKNEATRLAVEVLAGRVVGGIGTSPRDRRVFAALGDGLRGEGLDPVRDTKELAICYPNEHAGPIAVFGGDYSGKDVFRAIGRAAAQLGEKAPPVEERDSVQFVRLGSVIIARVAPNVIAVGDDLERLTPLATEADRSARYLYSPGLVATAVIGDANDGVRLRIAESGAEVSIELSIRTNLSDAQLESRREGAATRLEETPLRMLAPLASSAKITTGDGRAKLELRGRSSDVGSALQTASELPPNELKRILAYVFGGRDGTGTPEQKI